jgi:tetratricopeptide (TPR) repeat protein
VPLIYQKYRPQWAGREAEWLFQLHNTPAQLWAELGTMGIIATAAWFLAVIWLFWRLHGSSQWRSSVPLQIATYGLFGSLLGYTVLAITDFQLDVPAISGFLVISVASLAYIGAVAVPNSASIESSHGNPKDLETEQLEKNTATVPYQIPYQIQRFLSVIGLAGLIATLIWTTPLLLAWQSSSVGFILLRNARITLTEYTTKVNPSDNSQNNKLDLNLNNPNSTRNDEASQLLNIALGELDGFRQKLQNAHKLAPWQSYYPYQLGWNLAELSINYPNLPQGQDWQKEGLQWLQEAARLSPDTESAYNSIGWLSLSQGQHQTAATAFRNGLNLIASKRSLQLGLGISLWQQGQKDQAIAAFAQEILNEPSFITSPIWETPRMAEAYPLLCEFLNSAEMQKAFIAKFTPEFAARFLALLHWWQGKPINDVTKELLALKQPQTDLLAKVLRHDRQALASVISQPGTATEMLIAAWYRPQERTQLIEKAYVHATRNLPTANPSLLAAIASRMQELQSGANANPSVANGEANNGTFNVAFDQWLRGKLERQSPLILKYRRTRLGFGVVSRQIDGPIPSDFFQTEDRALISLFFSDLFS